MSALLSNTALLAALKESEQYKAFVVEFEAKAAEALTDKVYPIAALGGVELTLPEVAVYYQVYKSVPKALGDKARSIFEPASRECLAIIKAAGYKADWDGIVALAAHL
jgi:hypothetical protein